MFLDKIALALSIIGGLNWGLIGLFNFSESDKTAWINEADGEYVEMLSGNRMQPVNVLVPAYGFYYMKKIS